MRLKMEIIWILLGVVTYFCLVQPTNELYSSFLASFWVLLSTTGVGIFLWFFGELLRWFQPFPVPNPDHQPNQNHLLHRDLVMEGLHGSKGL
ncbi:unnamed protein product [Allacma fusca]|uniref:Uncharacterized protein n=1 Tax=Allacma fusca TaxID=39272 RepID=A0A8J2KMT8_9HEXA|nr:unnamed protein product [Allacma fusca]